MFSLSASHVATVAEWASRSKRRSADAAARRYARQNMVAIVMLANDDAMLYLFDVANNRIATVFHEKPKWSK